MRLFSQHRKYVHNMRLHLILIIKISQPSIRRAIGITTLFMLLLFALYSTFHEAHVYSRDRTPSVWDALAAQSLMLNCQRKPLASVSYFPRPRTYHHFDNILLIVFFSHARYDSIDDYKKVREPWRSITEY
jgi:hypothetical protein